MKVLVCFIALAILGSALGEDSPCGMPKETGPCRAFFQRYYYDQESGECKEFIYGGCNGNANNFKSNEECESQCVN